MNTSELKAGTIAIVKVGRNEVEVEVLEVLESKWQVKSLSTGRSFATANFVRIVSQPEDDEALNPAPASESGTAAQEKKLSLLEAAAQVIKQSQKPMNCKELIAKATECQLWIPTGAKTPEQSLYSAIFREIKTKETPRFRKSTERKGAFEFAG
jgi:hypothetical protein